MAGNTINFELRLNSNIKDQTKDARDLNKELDRSAKSSTAAAARQQTVEYGRARGSMEATGASARDFANQAQGLGGLVRLYATYAANVFALSAAFQSLSAAMDTQNMIRGMTQLSAATGQSIGAISKQFAAATQGALSTREALEATTRAMSSGLSSEQTLQIAEIATKASQALGVNLTDAVSRLTRGITKFEPELLDELGIFVRLDSAVEKYARQLGKASTALTEAERLQAFANATLDQGRKKFGEIELDINPYTKFLAVLKDLSLTLLTVVNTVLGPFVKLLSENPVLLAGAVALLAKNLLSNVIPVLKDYNEQLKRSTKLAEDSFNKQAASAKKYSDIRIKLLNEEKQKRIEALETREYTRLEALEKQQKLFETAFDSPRLQRSVRDILIKDIQDITDKEIKYLEKLGTRTKIYADLADSIKKVKTFDDDIRKINQQTNDLIQKRPGLFTQAGIAQFKAQAAQGRLGALQGAQTVGQAVDERGLLGGFQALKEVTSQQSKVSMFSGVLAGLAGGITLVGKALSYTFSLFARFLGVLAIAYAAWELISAIFIKNDKEVKAFNSSLEQLQETTKTATDNAKKYKDTLTVSSLIAQTNALEGSNTALEKLINNFEQATLKGAGLSNFIDGLLNKLGTGRTAEFISETGASINAQLQSITDPKLQQEAKLALQEIFNISTLAPDEIVAVLEIANKKSSAVLTSMATNANTTLAKIIARQKQLIDPLKELDTGFDNLDKSLKDLQKSFEPQDKYTDYLVNLIKQSELLSKAMSSSTTSIATFNKLVNEPGRLSLFPEESQESFKESLELYKIAAAEQAKLTSLRNQQAEAEDRLVANSEYIKANWQSIIRGTADDTVLFSREQVKQAEELIPKIRQQISEQEPIVTGLFAKASDKFKEGLTAASKRSVDIITEGYKRAAELAQIESRKQLLGLVPTTAENVREMISLELRSIEIRREEILAIRNLTNAIESQKVERDIERLTAERIRLTEEGGLGSVERIAEIGFELSRLTLRQQALESPSLLMDRINAREPGISLDAETLRILQQQRGTTEQLNQQELQRRNILISGAGQLATAKSAESLLQTEREINKTLAENQQFRETDYRFLQLSETEQKAYLVGQRSQEQLLQNELTLSKELAKADAFRASAQEARNQELYNVATAFDEAARNAEREATATFQTAETRRISQTTAELLAVQTERNAKAIQDEGEWLQRNFNQREFALQATLEQLNAENQRIDTLQAQGMITERGAKQQLAAIEARRIEIDVAQQILAVEKQIQQIRSKSQQDIAALGPGRDQEKEQIAANAQAEIQLAEQRIQQIRRLGKERQDNLTLQQLETSRLKAYEGAFVAAFDNMADALVSWAQTGKWAGKDLINSLIADIARYELRLQTSAIWGFVRQSVLGALIPGAAAANAAGLPPRVALDTLGGIPNAKGNIYDVGLQKFAKGGMFTNKVVTEPTYFKFAKGTGLMGEAGPEAIMPLKRDGQGNLGVRSTAQAPTVDIVINNNTPAQATTQQTVDSRGNRRIEVTLGDMVTGEMNRPGSSLRETMRNSYNMRPAMARR